MLRIITTILVLLLAVNLNANAGNSKVMKKLIGTWTVSAPAAPYEYQEAEVVFYKENGENKVKIITDYGDIPGNNLTVEKNKVTFRFEVQNLSCVSKLHYKKGKLEGVVETDEGDIDVTMKKKK